MSVLTKVPPMNLSRRSMLGRAALAAGAAVVAPPMQQTARAQAAAADAAPAALVVDPAPLHELSPHLYMQFMEPLGATDPGVEAAWSYDADDWRRDFVETTRDLAPPMLRFGGLLSRYYKWREGVGPANQRPLYRNYLWGGMETHRCGTHEFVNLCRKVAAEPMYCVNFLSDGRLYFGKMKEGNRTGDAQEAADWVAYCNDPDDKLRKSHGVAEPYNVKYWQLGNETNYGPGGFSKDDAIARTIEFSQAMRKRDPSVKLIGWGDTGGGRDPEPWAGDMAARAGEHVDMIAFHTMQQSPPRKETVLNGLGYQAAPQRAWDELMDMVPRVEKKLQSIEQSLDAKGSKHPIAITEGHLSLTPRNLNPILTEWLTGVYHARVMNVYQRHGARVKIATLADFNGVRWTSNALITQVPTGVSYLLPAGTVARLFRRHSGPQAVAVRSTAPALDVTASRAGNKVFLHVANTDFSRATSARLAVTGLAVSAARAFTIAPDDPRQAVTENQPNAHAAKEQAIAVGDEIHWSFPARSVTAVELTCDA
jgi:alpha-L-arabinofuranosidase